MNVDFDRRALSDLAGIQRHIAADSPLAAERMYDRLAAACRGLVDFPSRGRPSQRGGLRELTTVPPYVIFYSLSPDTVRIRRIVHGARLR